ncbi:protein kinase [Neobacillus drentensis]|uniref:protein kinase domain-containing protein n=1 Tax=Neobacillus drentensis TaxID=220684 RepID=UPI001F174C97|nr:protein kinase [Neobacillus drentensis]ULT56761.1 protein kinase [Neobacillus drentensis]
MSLQIGQQVYTETTRELLTIKKKLGEGGQGAVYLVEGHSKGIKALKWYNHEQANEEQKKMIRDLVLAGAPSGEAGKRFVWPIDTVVSDESSQFGYLMDLIDTSRFAELGEVWAKRKPTPNMKALCEISYATSDSYRMLHLSGRCYRDISSGNIMFDPKNGDVLICDNDNIGINNESETLVWGTMEYMAPEIIRGEAKPSTDTDLHSLAVLLFQLWIWHHPFHGQMEYSVRSWDLNAKRKIYGHQPVFIFDPTKKMNELPNDPDYTTAKKRWEVCPEPLKEKFIQAFTVGLQNPKQRVTESQWRKLFLQLGDSIVPCEHDTAENFWSEANKEVNCWYCGKPVAVPPRLLLKTTAGQQYILLNRGTVITRRHIDPTAPEEEWMGIVGEVVQNPNNPSVWGLRNKSTSNWIGINRTGAEKEIESQKAAPLQDGLKIQFHRNVEGIIIG